MDTLRGITLMVVSMAFFAVSDSFVKLAGQAMPLAQVMLAMGVGTGLGFTLWAQARGNRMLGPALRNRAVLLRCLSDMVGAIGFMSALVLIPISTASAILQAAPLMITMGAALILGQHVGWRRWSAIAVGFAGMLVIVRPGLSGFDPYALFAVLGMLGLAGRDLAARAVPRDIPNIQLAAYGSWMLVPAGVLVLPFTGAPVWPDAAGWGLLAGVLVFGAAGYLAITAAMRLGDVGAVTPFRYSRLVFALVIGVIVFGERPDALTYLGAALVIGSGLYTLLRERRLAASKSTP